MMKNPKCAASPDWCQCHRCFPPSGSATSLFTSPAEVPSTRTLSFLRMKNGKRRKWKQDRPIYIAAMYVYIYICRYIRLYILFCIIHLKPCMPMLSTYTYLCLEITIIRVSHVLYVWNRPNRYASAITTTITTTTTCVQELPWPNIAGRSPRPPNVSQRDTGHRWVVETTLKNPIGKNLQRSG